MGESTLCPPKIVVTKIKKIALGFFGTCGRHILDYFCSFKYITLDLKLNYFILKENPTNIYKLEHMKYIYVEINMTQSMKNYNYTSKLKLWVEFCSDFFLVNDIDIHQLNLGPFKNFG
jgi:hypothetical protein